MVQLDTLRERNRKPGCTPFLGFNLNTLTSLVAAENCCTVAVTVNDERHVKATVTSGLEVDGGGVAVVHTVHRVRRGACAADRAWRVRRNRVDRR